MATFYIKEENLNPVLETVLKNPDDTAFDLSASTSVTFRMKRMGKNSYTVNAAATITDAANGVVEYQFADGETDVFGFYLVEWVVDAGLSTEETFKNFNYDGVYIERKL